MRKLSVNICLTMRHWVAPRAPRIATSRARSAARPNCMFITLTQAMRSTTTTAPSMAYMIWRSCWPVNALINGCTLAEVSWPLLFGLSFAIRFANPVNSAFTWSGVTPAFNRPMIAGPIPATSPRGLSGNSL